MKRVTAVMGLMLFFWLFAPHAGAEEKEPLSNEAPAAEEVATGQADALELHSISDFWETILDEYGGFLPESQKGTVKEMIDGDKELSPQTWLKAFVHYLFHEVIANGKLLGTLILLTIFCSFYSFCRMHLNKALSVKSHTHLFIWC